MAKILVVVESPAKAKTIEKQVPWQGLQGRCFNGTCARFAEVAETGDFGR